MAYSTAQNVKDDIATVVKPKSDAWIASQITSADAMIDDRLRDKYSVPFSTTPTLIYLVSLLLAKAWCIRDIFQDYQDEKNSGWKAMETMALDILEGIAKGKFNIGVETLAEATTTLAGAGIDVNNIPIYSEDETETDDDKKSAFYLPVQEEPE